MAVSGKPVPDDDDIAREIVSFLVEKNRFGGPSTLAKYVHSVIDAMALEIARITVENTPEIRTAIEQYTRDVIHEIVGGDPERIVQKAVSRAVGEVLARQRDKLRNIDDDG